MQTNESREQILAFEESLKSDPSARSRVPLEETLSDYAVNCACADEVMDLGAIGYTFTPATKWDDAMATARTAIQKSFTRPDNDAPPDLDMMLFCLGRPKVSTPRDLALAALHLMRKGVPSAARD